MLKSKNKTPLYRLVMIILLSSSIAFSQVDENKKNENIKNSVSIVSLDSIILETPIIKTSLKKSVFGVQVLGEAPIKTANSEVTVNHLLNQIAGINSSNNEDFTQDLRISIRGFGARSAFGTRGVKLLIDGIPETTTDGSTAAELLDILSLSKIEVLKGPIAGLYGNSSGGVILAKTDRPAKKDIFVRTSLGSFNTQRYVARVANTFKKGDFLLQSSYITRDGYRAHNNSKKIYLLATTNLELSEQHHLRIDARYVSRPESLSPGGITLEDVKKDRTVARDRNIDLNSSEKVDHIRLATNYKFEISDQSQLRINAWFTNRNLVNRIPVPSTGHSLLNRNFYGLQAYFNQKIQNLNLNFEAGYQSQQDARDVYAITSGGNKGAQKSKQNEQYQNINASAKASYTLSKDILLQGGVRYDYFLMDIKDQFLSNGNQSFSNPMNATNPYLGLNVTISPHYNAFANFGTTFETPTLNEISKNGEDIGYNTNLKPQTSTGYEIGLRANYSKLYYQLLGYLVHTQDEIFQTSPTDDTTLYINTGQTKRIGVEGNLTWAFIKNFKLSSAFNFSNMTFGKNAGSNDKDKGNTIPGVPVHQVSIQLQYQTEHNWSVRIEYLNKGTIYANNANTIKTEPYNTFTLKAQKKWAINNIEIMPFVNFSNLFGEAYYSNIRINAFGKRYYEPAPKFNLYGGVQVNF